MDSMDGYVADDDLAIEPLRELGWEVRTLSWRQTDVAWDDFEVVVLRTTWDYQQFPDEFLRVMEQIDRSIARLENPLDIVRWNFDKRYLREMDGRDALIVPTIWDASYSRGEFGRWMTELSCDELIIKPTVSATAGHTYRLREYDEQLESVFADRSFMIQPFMPNIVAEGEYSLFYFNGEYSHAINKSPKDADFRVQEEHGGIITPVEPDERLLRVAGETLAMIGRNLLYARVDFVRDAADNFALMEFELIEPALYFRMDAGSAGRFARAIDTRMREQSG